MPQVRIGWRPNTTQSQSVSTLIASLYGAWNGEAATNELDKSLFGSWNGDSTGTSSLKTSIHGVWNGESNANDSYGSKNGSIVGSVTYTAGKIGNSFTFNGSNSYVTLPSGTLEFTGDFSVSLWFNGSSVSGEKQIISNANKVGGASGQWKGWDLFIYGGKVYYRLWNSGTNSDAISSTTISGSTWYHVVITKSGSVQKLYINGALEATNSSAVTPNYTTPNFPAIGVQYYHSGIGYDTPTIFNGRIDAVSAWTKELTLSEISELYNSGNGAQYVVDNFYKPTASDALGANNGTAQGGLTYDVGKLGAAFQFNGTNAYVSLPDDIFNFTGDFSASAWFYTPSAAYAHAGIVGNYNWGTKTGWGIYTYQNRLYANIYNVAGDYSTAYIDNSVVGSWNHVVMVFKKGTGFYLYMNGDLKNSFTLSNNANAGYSPVYAAGQTARIGLMNYSGDWWYAGNGYKIDGVNVWQRAISRDEVVQLYNSGTGAQYPFSGTLSSAGNQLGMDNGTLMNGCYLSDGKVGKAFTFDGVNDYVSLPNNSLNFTGDFSIGLWVYFNSLNNPNSQWNQQFIFSNNPIGFGNGFSLYKHSNNSLYFIVSDGTNTSFFRAPQTLQQSTWYHVVITRKYGTATKIYINGSEQTDSFYYSGSVSTNPTYLANQVVNLSGWGNAGGDLMNGKIDGFTTWQKVLTQAEVAELYNSGAGNQVAAASIVKSNLVLNLDASRTSSYPRTGSAWYDISGNSNNGTLANGPSFGTASSGAINLNGTTQYISIPGLANYLNNKTKFSYETWFKANSTTSFGTLFSFGNNDNYSNDIIFFVLNNQICVQVNNGADGGAVASFTSTGWNNISVVYDGTKTGNANRLKLYLNGVLQTLAFGSYNVPASTSNTSMVNAGLGAYSTGGWNNFLSGSIATSRLYTSSLTDLEVLQNFNATKSRFGL